MSEFAFIYRGQEPNRSPEQVQHALAVWTAWFKSLAAQGHIQQPGYPLEDEGRRVTGSRKVVTDGPFAEAKDVVGGFTLVQARDLNHAVELAGGCPILDAGGTVEVRPIRPMQLCNG